MDEREGEASSAPVESKSRILSYNLNVLPLGVNYSSGGYKSERLKEFTERCTQYDILVLQEVYTSSVLPFGVQSLLCGQKFLRNKLAALGFVHQVASPEPTFYDMLRFYRFTDLGLLIASKYPISISGSLRFVAHAQRWETHKGCVFAKVHLSQSHSLGIFNVHLQADHGSPSQELIRTQQISELRQLVESFVHRNQPLSAYVVAGNFNVNAIEHSMLDQFGFAFDSRGKDSESAAYRNMRQLLDPHGTMTELVLQEFGRHLPTRPLSLAFPSTPLAVLNHRCPARHDYMFFCSCTPSFKRKESAIEVPKGGVRVEKFPGKATSPYGYLSDHFGIVVALKSAAPTAHPWHPESAMKIVHESKSRQFRGLSGNGVHFARIVEALVLLLVMIWIGWAVPWFRPSVVGFITILIAVLLAASPLKALDRTGRCFGKVTSAVKQGLAPILQNEKFKMPLFPQQPQQIKRAVSFSELSREPSCSDSGSVWDLFSRSVEAYGWLKCIGTQTSDDRGPNSVTWMTYKDVDVEVRRFGSALIALGVRPGEKVALYTVADYRAFVVELACAAFGFVTFPLVGDSTTVRLLLNRTSTKVVVASAVYTQRVLRSRSSTVTTVIQCENVQFDESQLSDEMGIKLIPYEYILRKVSESDVQDVIRPKSTDACTLLCDVMGASDASFADALVFKTLTHHEVLHQAHILVETRLVPPFTSQLLESQTVPLATAVDAIQGVMLSTSPCDNLFGRLFLLACVRCGYRIGFCDVTNINSVFAACKLYAPTVVLATHSFFYSLMMQFVSKVGHRNAIRRFIFRLFYALRAKAIHHGSDIPLLKWLFFSFFDTLSGGRVKQIVIQSFQSLPFEHLEFAAVCGCPNVREICFSDFHGILCVDGIPPPRLGVKVVEAQNREFNLLCPCGELMIASSSTDPDSPFFAPNSWSSSRLVAAWKQDSLNILCPVDALLWRLPDVYVIATELEREFSSRSKFVSNIFVTCFDHRPLVAVVVPDRHAFDEWKQNADDYASWMSFVQLAKPIILDDLRRVATEIGLPGTHYIHGIHLHPHPFADHSDFLMLNGSLRRARICQYFKTQLEQIDDDVAVKQGNAPREPVVSDISSSLESPQRAIVPVFPSQLSRRVAPLSLDIGGTCGKVVLLNLAKNVELPGFCVPEHTFLSSAGVKRSQPFDSLAPSSPTRSAKFSGELSFVKFPSNRVADFVEFIASLRIAQEGYEEASQIPATGGGAYKYSTLVHDRLGMELSPQKEMDCVVRGINFLLRNCEDCAFTYDLKTSQTASHVLIKSTHKSIAPYILVNIGSGVSIVKCTSTNGGFTRIGGSAVGGGTFWGLVKLLTNIKSWDELHEVTRVDGPGDNTKVDLLVGDIYGFNAMNLPAMLSCDTIASTFGKIGSSHGTPTPSQSPISVTDHHSLEHDFVASPFRSFNADVRPTDVVRSLLIMTAMNICQISHLFARVENVKNIFFTGGFVRDNPLVWQNITAGMYYWTNGTVRPHFIHHDMYLGALGALLAFSQESGVAEPSPGN